MRPRLTFTERPLRPGQGRCRRGPCRVPWLRAALPGTHDRVCPSPLCRAGPRHDEAGQGLGCSERGAWGPPACSVRSQGSHGPPGAGVSGRPAAQDGSEPPSTRGCTFRNHDDSHARTFLYLVSGRPCSCVSCAAQGLFPVAREAETWDSPVLGVVRPMSRLWALGRFPPEKLLLCREQCRAQLRTLARAPAAL